MIVWELDSKLKSDYSNTGTVQSPMALPPAQIETKAIQLVKENTFKLGGFKNKEDFIRLIIGNWDTFIAHVRNELEEKYDSIFGTTLERAVDKASKESSWTELQKLIFCCKETLKPLFVERFSPLIQKAIALLGTEFEDFTKTTFNAGVVQELLEFIIEQIYAVLGGPGSWKSLSWRSFLIDLCLVILELILFLLLEYLMQALRPGYPPIAAFLRLIPSFIKYIINQIRNYLRK
jgi:hypothetical protein